MNLEVGSIVTGKVTGIAKFGAFVTIAPNVSGLVHISEVANTYIANVEEHLSVGQEVTVKVISIDQNKRINLSIKQALPPEENPRPAKPSRPRGEGAPRQQRPAAPRPRPEYKKPSEQPPVYEAPKPKSDNASFEDTLKKFLQESDSKISESGRYDRQRSNRRRGGGKQY